MNDAQKRREARYNKPSYCQSPHIYLAGVLCGLPAGHDGDHQVIIRWKQDPPPPPPPLGINVVETVTVEDKFGD